MSTVDQIAAIDSPLAGALFMAELGFSVFPLMPGSKKPFEFEHCELRHRPLAGGINRATRDAEKIKRWAAVDPDICLNFGVSTDDIVVIDVDTKHDADIALEEYLALGCPPTFTVQTPSGGWHEYFSGPSTGQSKLGKSIDVRSKGGYVVSPGSRIAAESYVIRRGCALAALPEGIRAKIGKAGERNRQLNKAPVCEFDLPHNVDKATEAAASFGPAEDGGRNNAAFNNACRLKDLGVSELTALGLLTAWNERNNPPLDDGELQATVENAFDHGQNQPGCRTPEAEFSDVPNALGQIRLAPSGRPRLLAQRCDEVEMKRIEWHWSKRFPRGMCSLLAGHGGLGKSTVLIDIAARTTTGTCWPDDSTRAEVGSVIYFATEDPAAQVLKPRFVAAGGDPKRLHLASSVQAADGKQRRTFNLKDDLALLEELMDSIGDVRLLIFDPISAYFGTADTWRNTEVRAALEPIGEMAARRDLTVIGNTHLTKGSKGAANARVLDSVAMTAHARSVYMVIEDAEDPNRRLFIPSKGNLGPRIDGLSFTIASKTVDLNLGIEGSYVVWGGGVTATADEALAAADDKGRKLTAVDLAAEFIRDFLSAGSKSSAEIFAAGMASGHAERTLRRAAAQLKVQSRKDGMTGGWVSELPG